MKSDFNSTEKNISRRMSEIEAMDKAITWSNESAISQEERKEFEFLVTGRSLSYAPVDNPLSFCADMKPSTGRLMDFNKGMFLRSYGLYVEPRHNYTWICIPVGYYYCG